MSSGVATWIGVLITLVLLVAVVVWALVRHRRTVRRQDWVALESEDVDDLDIGRDPPATFAAADSGNDDDGDHDRPPTTAAATPTVLPDAVLDADGDLRAKDEIAAVIDANGTVVALTKPARRRFDADTGVPHTDLGRMRPVAGADGFVASHHPISRALAGEHVDRWPCVVETSSSILAGAISAQPVMVEEDELVLVYFEVASDG